MRYTFSQKAGHILRAIVAWAMAYALFGFLRIYGIEEMPNVDASGAFDIQSFMTQLLLASIITGILYGTVDLIFDRPSIQRWSYWRILVAKSIMHFFIVGLVLTALLFSRVKLGIVDEGYFNPELPNRFSQLIHAKSFIVFIIYFTLISWLLNAYQQVKQKFGRGLFTDMLIGRYHHPQEADRIFMFLDLRSSVALAERLGHVKFSSLLQDCYFDLNTQVDRYRAKVYQYVGDLVVLYWNVPHGIAENNCLKCFFAFIERLEKNRLHYEEKYGCLPYFKAAAHVGRVTVAEVGMIKRDIAFHGDTINTTSRLQDQCNTHGERLLISRHLHALLEEYESFDFRSIGDHILHGRHEMMEIFAVRKKGGANAPGEEKPGTLESPAHSTSTVT